MTISTVAKAAVAAIAGGKLLAEQFQAAAVISTGLSSGMSAVSSGVNAAMKSALNTVEACQLAETLEATSGTTGFDLNQIVPFACESRDKPKLLRVSDRPFSDGLCSIVPTGQTNGKKCVDEFSFLSKFMIQTPVGYVAPDCPSFLFPTALSASEQGFFESFDRLLVYATAPINAFRCIGNGKYMRTCLSAVVSNKLPTSVQRKKYYHAALRVGNELVKQYEIELPISLFYLHSAHVLLAGPSLPEVYDRMIANIYSPPLGPSCERIRHLVNTSLQLLQDSSLKDSNEIGSFVDMLLDVFVVIQREVSLEAQLMKFVESYWKTLVLLLDKPAIIDLLQDVLDPFTIFVKDLVAGRVDSAARTFLALDQRLERIQCVY